MAYTVKVIKYAQIFYSKALETHDPELDSPNVVIQPGTPALQKAVEILKRMDPNYFVGVRTIIVGVSPDFGHVESGPDKDPSIINVNLNKINQQAGGQTTGPEVIKASALVIAHERGHVKSYNQQQGFVGGEGPAMTEENRVKQWMETNQSRIQDLLQ